MRGFSTFVFSALALVACSSQPPAPLESRGQGATTVTTPAPVEIRSSDSTATTTPVAEPAPVTATSTTAPSAAPPATAPAVDDSGVYYRVKPKDNLYRIAVNHGQNYHDLALWNNIEDPTLIHEGMLLRVSPPGQGGAAAPATRQTKPAAQNNAAPTATVTTARPSGKYERKTTPSAAKVPYGNETKPAAQKKTQSSGATRSGAENVVWSWPTTNPIRTGYSSKTKGLEFSGAMGDPIRAAANGKVVYAGSGLRGYGELVIIKHSTSFLTAYGHNRKILVKEGDSVKRGQKIAEMGNSDSSTVQLHFEVRRQGKPVNPNNYLPAR